MELSVSNTVNNPQVVAVIPAFNEERTIASVVLRTMKHVDLVVVCDDGSDDMTGDISEKLGALVIRHENNLGKGAALRTAFKFVNKLNPRIVVTMDGDGQHDPDDIPKLLEPLFDGIADVSVGSRYVDGSFMNPPMYRKFGLKLINRISVKNERTRIRDTQCGFRAFTSKASGQISNFESDGFGVETEQLSIALKNGLNIVEVPINVKYDGLHRTSKKNPIFHGSELVSIVLKLIVEKNPLLYMGLPGVISLLISAGVGGYLLWIYNSTRYFSIPFSVIFMMTFFIGTIFIISSIMLYAISRISKMNKKIINNV